MKIPSGETPDGGGRFRQGRILTAQKSKEVLGMADFKMSGDTLYDRSNRKIGFVRGNDIFDSSNRKVASVKGSDIFDSASRKVGSLRGIDIYDAQNRKIGTISDVKKEIDGAMGGASVVALWLSFIR
jgi:rRNA processing protein Gar1